MKRPVVMVVSVAVLVLCLLALDDITTGNEPHLGLEMAMVAVGILWLGGLGLARACRRWRR